MPQGGGRSVQGLKRSAHLRKRGERQVTVGVAVRRARVPVAASVRETVLGSGNMWLYERPKGYEVEQKGKHGMEVITLLVMRWLMTFPDPDAEFFLIDTNHDGYVTPQELQAAVAPYGPMWSALPQSLFAMADTDRNGAISLAEFRQLAIVLRENAMLRQSMFG